MVLFFYIVQSSPRNSPYQESSGFRRRLGSFQGQTQTLRWVLSPDREQNAAVRNEFSYEQVRNFWFIHFLKVTQSIYNEHCIILNTFSFKKEN